MKTNTRIHERGGVCKSKKRRVRRKARQRTYFAARVHMSEDLVLEPSFVSKFLDTNEVSMDHHARGYEHARDASNEGGEEGFKASHAR